MFELTSNKSEVIGEMVFWSKVEIIVLCVFLFVLAWTIERVGRAVIKYLDRK